MGLVGPTASSTRRAVFFSISAILLLALILFFSFIGSREEPHRKLNATCKHENVTGIYKSKDACHTNLTSVEFCDGGDLSLVCCPLVEKKVNNDRFKRTPGEKAKEMCKLYGQKAYKYVPTYSVFDEQFVREKTCKDQQKLIKNGINAEENEFPHMVRIGNFEDESGNIEWQCGGSIISPTFILSAAHCNVIKEKGYAIFGTIKTDQSVDNHTVSIKKVHIHPHYNAENNNNDIALFELTESLNIDNERPICLDTGTTLHNNLEVIATGFGVNKDMKRNELLQKVYLNIRDQRSCISKYKPRILPEHTICAYSEGKDACVGDSGGPLQTNHNELECMYTLIGITSFGDNCTLNSDIPGVYTKVSSYIEWIEDTVWPG